MPLRIGLEKLLAKVQAVISKDAPLDTANVNSASVKVNEAKKVRLWFIVVILLLLTGLIMPGGKTAEPLAIKSTEVVEPSHDVEELKASTTERDELERALEEIKR